MSAPLDLLALDRDVRRAALRVEQWRAWLRVGTRDARDLARSFDPWDGVRHTAVQATYRALVELEPSAFEVPLRDGLRRWVYELLQARLGFELTIADADAETALDARLSKARAAALKARESAALLPGALGEEDLGDREVHTYREALAGIVAAPHEAGAAAALRRAGELAAPVAAVRKERQERRFEVARRLGLGHPWALSSSAEVDVGALARALLDATEPLAMELLARARKASGRVGAGAGDDGPWRASSAIQLALGRAAREGWPAYLGSRWLDDAFKALAPRGVDAGTFAEPQGSASFLRAAVAWGSAWRASGAPRSMPFAIARDPYPVPAVRFGYAIASAVALPAFQKRMLELPQRVAAAQARVLGTTSFFHARTVAARAWLASVETREPSLFEEVTSRVFGAPLPAAMRDAWPAPRVDEPARLLGLLGTRAFVRDLVERFDDDWFRNPKAGQHLTSLACGPAFDLEPLDEAAPSKLARAFEEALG
jgi:hypothetical protein